MDTRLQWALGLGAAQLVDSGPDGLLLADTASALKRLRQRAKKAGFDLAVASGFRSYTRQLAIFNAKAAGERVVMGEHGHALDLSTLNDTALLDAILRFSALPGTSRHHWGTDVDVWDASAVGQGYALALTPDEYASGGVFAAMSEWLDTLVAADDAEGFFRPYARDHGGVAPEAWHLSYRPGVRGLAALQSADNLLPLWRASAEAKSWGISTPLALLDTLEANIEAVLAKYRVIDEVP